MCGAHERPGDRKTSLRAPAPSPPTPREHGRPIAVAVFAPSKTPLGGSPQRRGAAMIRANATKS